MAGTKALEPAAVSPPAIVRAVTLKFAAATEVPETANVNPVATSLQIEALRVAEITGSGLIVITTVLAVPRHPDPLVGVMVYVAVIAALDVLLKISLI